MSSWTGSLAPLLVGHISENTKSLFEQLKKDKERKNIDDKFGVVCFEMAFFYLHFIDRIAFQRLGAGKRDVFINVLFVEFREVLSRVHESGIEAEQFRSTFAEAYDERQQEYDKYKGIFPEKDESLADTLMWKFGAKLAKMLDSEKDPAIVLYVSAISIEFIKTLELSELLSEQK